MRNFDCINSITLGLGFIILSSCSGIFVPDPIDPRLPKYTEEGNNVAGAFIDDGFWKSVVKFGLFTTDDAPSVISWPTGDSITINFGGEDSYGRSDIEFHLRGLKINSFEDLLRLNDKKIQLDGVSNSGYYTKNYDPTSYTNKGIGQIYFRNVSSKDSTSLITLSGTFGFTVDGTGGASIKISYGRFDYKIDQFNFHTE
jgi:hypothetical protein